MTQEQQIIEAIKAGDADTVRELIETDIFLADAQAEDGTSALLTAIYVGQEDIARIILASGPTLSMYEAAAIGDKERVEDLIYDEPQTLNAYSHDGWTPLHLAVYFNRNEVAELLIKQGANVNAIAQNDLCITPLHSALSNRNARLARLLLERGANPLAKQSGGFTPLHYAAANGLAEIVRTLLDKRADPMAKNKEGKTAGDLATEKGHEAIAKLLEQSNANNDE